jgi:ABC-type transport system involved in multi-copper enzyme maturation permease subunit
MTTNTFSLTPRRERGWKMGLANMLAKENVAWWRTRRWWTQCLVAMFFLNFLMALNLLGSNVNNAVTSFLMIEGVVAAIAAAIMGQDAIQIERTSGTAAWVLSKPLRRPAFILAKLITYAVGFLVTWFILPGAVAYLELAVIARTYLPVTGFVGMLGLAYLSLLFYMTLAMMLTTLFQGRGPVLGITIFLAWGFMIPPLGILLADVMPWRLIQDLGKNGSIASLGKFLWQGLPLPTVIPIIVTAVWCLLFVVVAIWRISREEF